MDQEKMGKLIATLRKQKGLTQSELGAKVGVGDRAVSKWERGITSPDISIINEISKILGITTDELLTGTLNEEHTNLINSHSKFNKKLLLIPFILLIVIIILFIINKNKSDVYHLTSKSDEYRVSGQVIFNKDNNVKIIISELVFRDKEFNEIKINNYEYNLRCNNILIFRKGNFEKGDVLPKDLTIKELANYVTINYNDELKISKKEMLNNGMTLTIAFQKIDNTIITKAIEISLTKDK